MHVPMILIQPSHIGCMSDMLVLRFPNMFSQRRLIFRCFQVILSVLKSFSVSVWNCQHFDPRYHKATKLENVNQEAQSISKLDISQRHGEVNVSILQAQETKLYFAKSLSKVHYHS